MNKTPCVPPMRVAQISLKLYEKLLEHAPIELLAEITFPHTGVVCLVEELGEEVE